MKLTIEIFAHRRNSPARIAVVEDDGNTTVEDFVLAEFGEGGQMWLEDAEEPLSSSATLKSAGVGHRSRVHLGTCLRVEVAVHYAGEQKERSFPPGATIMAVFRWAVGPQGFNLTQEERAKHTLFISGTTNEPDKTEHVGTFATDECSVSFDLAPKERFEG